ncbi:MAG TPA: ATP synthase F0 subunit B [Candidatus Acidoferrales bacterium]|nr:ATP synthase F0 subunit B [Candidatus Acidoferrales bacterium]
MFLSLDGTFWIQLLNFAIFFAILNVVFLRPVGRAISERRAYIDSVRADYDRHVREAADLRKQAEADRAAARQAAAETFHTARNEAIAQAEHIAAEYAGKAGEIVRQARATVASELEQAHRKEAELARTLADAMLERAISEVLR